MKKIIAIFPSDYDWSSAVEDGLAFGIGAALCLRILPAMLRTVRRVAGRFVPCHRVDTPPLPPNLRIFGQRH
jgi:hypothetical protein